MKTSAQMESLWQYIQSLSLSERNRRWLADRLVEPTATMKVGEEPAEYISKREILAGIDAGLKDFKAGRMQSFDDFIKEMENEI